MTFKKLSKKAFLSKYYLFLKCKLLTATYNILRQKYELSNKYTAVSNLKSYIKIDPNNLIVYKPFYCALI